MEDRISDNAQSTVGPVTERAFWSNAHSRPNAQKRSGTGTPERNSTGVTSVEEQQRRGALARSARADLERVPYWRRLETIDHLPRFATQVDVRAFRRPFCSRLYYFVCAFDVLQYCVLCNE